MNNFYIIEIQTHSNGTSGNIVTGFEDRGTSEDAYLDTRKAARQSQVACHTIVWMDKLGNTIEKMSYAHDEPIPESQTPSNPE